MSAISMYFTHALDFRKGWPNPAACDVVAVKSSNVTVNPVYGGRVAHLNAAAQFELGALGTQMPIFLIQGAADFDVSNPSPAGAYAWYAIAPNGHMSGLVADTSYELETTEYDQTQAYAPNDLLHSPTESQITGADKSAAGLLFNMRTWPGGAGTKVTQYVDNIVGVVSTGAVQNALRQAVVRFWPYFLPGQDATH